jgi:hypothetical protein
MEVGGATWRLQAFWMPTNITSQNSIAAFYEGFAKWIKDNSWNHVLYIGVWPEASFYSIWYDGRYFVEHNVEGHLCQKGYPECNADWKDWLSSHGITPVDLTFESIDMYIDQYCAWSRNRFARLTKIKADAVKRGYSEVLVGGEIGYANPTIPPQKNKPWHPANYLECAGKEYLDVIDLHDYMPDKTYYMDRQLESNLDKIVVGGEIGTPWWEPYYSDTTMTEKWWAQMEPKLRAIFGEYRNGYGYCIWNWHDYPGQKKPWGLKDMDWNPRPVLNLVSSLNYELKEQSKM